MELGKNGKRESNKSINKKAHLPEKRRKQKN